VGCSFGFEPILSARCAVGGSKTTVTLLFPQAGHISLDSSLESGKFRPRVQTSVSRSSCLRYTQRRMDRVSRRWPLEQRICTFQPRLRATPSVSTSIRTKVEHLLRLGQAHPRGCSASRCEWPHHHFRITTFDLYPRINKFFVVSILNVPNRFKTSIPSKGRLTLEPTVAGILYNVCPPIVNLLIFIVRSV
jgi:hypothetical protein